MGSSDTTKETVKQIFTEYLTKNKMRKTLERFAILDQIYSLDGHFDIESLYSILKESNYPVSKATLYNNINLLLECNLIIKHNFDSNISEYEKCYNTNTHNHLICTKCGAMKEFTDTNIKRTILSKHIKNFAVSSYSLSIYGICSKCQKEKKQTDK
ncbi:MAG TPA: transcriptional repressor [Paludibacteraceae bacterium]|jgi:Fur family ferric uptake transcriptional regulator|nr:transcriptional repressor [Paludibacteraceae bacterium]HOU68347.1 transcriptional repressor [Paludibacteraceae bacterium]HPH63746.1 transcriptional repressor [Paludibacteraceae bacterium]HQF50204.1 transcriptional repressor [Paludibacteraceae bacterium]